MDNIQKLVFGVIGVAGLLAMLTPSDMPVPQPVAAVEVAQSVPNPDETAEAQLLEDEAVDAEEIDDDPFAIGEPSIDGTPIGQPADSNQPNPAAPQSYPWDQNQFGVPNYANQAQQGYSSAPPVNNVPLGPDGFAQVPGQ
jgi:hypothetical protein